MDRKPLARTKRCFYCKHDVLAGSTQYRWVEDSMRTPGWVNGRCGSRKVWRVAHLHDDCRTFSQDWREMIKARESIETLREIENVDMTDAIAYFQAKYREARERALQFDSTLPEEA